MENRVKAFFMFSLLMFSSTLIMLQGQAREIDLSRQHALIIGINKYGYMRELNNPVDDCKKIQSLLELKYGYQKNNIKTLFNYDATKGAIIARLKWYKDNLDEKDSLFIYFSGHGHQSEKLKEKGFLIPSDIGFDLKEKGYSVNHFGESGILGLSNVKISYSYIFEFMQDCKAKHIFMVSDACYSAAFFKETGDKSKFYPSPHLYDKKSRQFLAAGEYQVPDGPFAKVFIEILNRDKPSYGGISASGIISEITRRFENDPRYRKQYPKGGRVFDAGDNEGEFYFWLKIMRVISAYENVEKFIGNKTEAEEDKLRKANYFLIRIEGLPDNFRKHYSHTIEAVCKGVIDYLNNHECVLDEENNLLWTKDSGQYAVYEEPGNPRSVTALLSEKQNTDPAWQVPTEQCMELLLRNIELRSSLGVKSDRCYWTSQGERNWYITYKFPDRYSGIRELSMERRRSTDGANYIFVKPLTEGNNDEEIGF